MEANHVVKFEGREVSCYGELAEDSNFSVVCDDEWDDSVWCDGDPVTGNPFLTWETVLERLQPYYNSEIVEITSC